MANDYTVVTAQARVKAAYAASAAGAAFAPEDLMVRFQGNIFDADLGFTQLLERSWAQLTDPLRTFVFDLLKANMSALYGEEWSDEEKAEELADEKARFLVLERPTEAQAPPGTTSDPTCPTDLATSTCAAQPCGYVHFRFVEEEGTAMLYIYELQLSPGVLRKGLGRYLDGLCEKLARARAMDGILLTVFKHNTAAVAFYERMGYEAAPHSPSRCWVDLKAYAEQHLTGERAAQMHQVEQESANYEIMGKVWCEGATEALKKFAAKTVKDFVTEALAAIDEQLGLNARVTRQRQRAATEPADEDAGRVDALKRQRA